MDIGKPDECERAGCDAEPVENISTGEPIPPSGLGEESSEVDDLDPTYVCRNCEIEFAERLPMSVNEFINDEKTEEWDPI